MSATRKNLILSLILFIGAWLHFTRLKPAGLYYWDQGYFSVEAQTTWEILSKVPDYFRGRPIQDIKNDIHEKCGGIFPTGCAKPGFIFLLTFAEKLTGSQDISITLLSGFMGLMSLLLVFLIGKKLQDEETGLWSAAILLLSSVQLFFVRNGTSTITTTFFYLIGFLILLHECYFLSGLMMGIAFTCHYAVLPSIAVLAGSVFTLGLMERGGNKIQLFKNAARWLGGLVILPVLIECVYQLIYYALGPANLQDLDFHTYFFYILRQFLWMGYVMPGPNFIWMPAFFLKMLIEFQGWSYFLIFIISTFWVPFWLYRRRSLGWLWLVVGQASILLLIWICKTGYVGGRVIAFMVPFQCLLIGTLIRNVRWQLLKVVLFAAVVIPALPPIYRLIHLRSGYAEAARFLQLGPERIITFENGPIWHFYLGQKKLYRNPKTFSESQIITDIKSTKVRYLVIDLEEMLSKETGRDEKKWVRKIQNTIQPIISIPNPLSCDRFFLYERYDLVDYRSRPEACFIHIYDLSTLPL